MLEVQSLSQSECREKLRLRYVILDILTKVRTERERDFENIYLLVIHIYIYILSVLEFQSLSQSECRERERERERGRDFGGKVDNLVGYIFILSDKEPYCVCVLERERVRTIE